jgi:hypothetical protein
MFRHKGIISVLPRRPAFLTVVVGPQPRMECLVRGTPRPPAFAALGHPFRRRTAAYRGSTITLTCDDRLPVR